MAVVKSMALPRWVIVLLALIGAGCQHDRHSEIPSDAVMMSEGEDVSFRATESGTVYVYNRDDNRMVYSGDMRRGEMIVVDRDKNRVTLDGRTVLEKGVDRDDTMRVFFKPDVIRRERVIVEERRETR